MRTDYDDRARRAVSNAIRKGILKRGPCAECGKSEVDGHHSDYSKPLDVIWLCRKHHRAIHSAAGIPPAKRRKVLSLEQIISQTADKLLPDMLTDEAPNAG